jgi:hypothetical protein
MKAYATYFDARQDGIWERMANVLRYTCQQNGVDVTIEPMPIPENGRGMKIESNHEKLKLWNRAVQEATEPIILLDADMFCQRNPAPIMATVKHVGITYRDQTSFPPINGGVVYVQPTIEAKAFFTAWVESDAALHDHPAQHAAFRSRYAGMNQASLGMIMEAGMDHLVTRLTCSQTNCVEPWLNWQESAFVHVKSQALWHIFYNNAATNKNVPQIKDKWLELEKSCLQSRPNTPN